MGERGEALRALHDFVLARLEDRVRLAEEAGDSLDRSFALASREFLLALGHDISARPWTHDELERFLLRSARRYRRHPDFHENWAGSASDQ